MEVIGIGAIMMLPMIALGVTLVLSHEATKDIGKIAEDNESNIEYVVEQTFKELREATKDIDKEYDR